MTDEQQPLQDELSEENSEDDEYPSGREPPKKKPRKTTLKKKPKSHTEGMVDEMKAFREMSSKVGENITAACSDFKPLVNTLQDSLKMIPELMKQQIQGQQQLFQYKMQQMQQQQMQFFMQQQQPHFQPNAFYPQFSFSNESFSSNVSQNSEQNSHFQSL